MPHDPRVACPALPNTDILPLPPASRPFAPHGQLRSTLSWKSANPVDRQGKLMKVMAKFCSTYAGDKASHSTAKLAMSGPH
jgi:hypothetical protein